MAFSFCQRYFSLNFPDTVLWITAGGSILSLFLGLQALRVRESRDQEKLLLALVLFTFSLNILHGFFTFNMGLRLFEPMQFLFTPILAFYFHTLLGITHKPSIKWVLHLLPFIAIMVIFPFLPNETSGVPWGSLITWGALVIQAMVYLIPLFGKIHREEQNLLTQVSSLKGRDLKWVLVLMRVFLGLYGAYGLIWAGLIHGIGQDHIQAFLTLTQSAAVWILGWRGLYQKPLPPPLPPEGKTPAQETIDPQLLRRVKEQIAKEKPFLDPELNLTDLAESLGLTRHQLSLILNQGLGTNFYDYINSLRVQEVLRLMEDPEKKDWKVLALAFEAGFNSKPTFNLAFKKHTGKVPSDFRLGK